MQNLMDDLPLVAGDAALRTAFATKRIVTTRPTEQARSLIDRIVQLGAEALPCPAISIAPIDNDDTQAVTPTTVASFDWLVFTSVNAVNALALRLNDHAGAEARARPAVAAIGRATAAAAAANGWTVQFAPETSTGADMGKQLPIKSGQRVLLPRCDIASPDLPNALRQRGAAVREAVLYRTIPDAALGARVAELATQSIDAVIFASPSAVQYFMAEARLAKWDLAALNRTDRTTIACIGTTTAAAARRFALRPVIASDASAEGLIRALALSFVPIPEILFAAGGL